MIDAKRKRERDEPFPRPSVEQRCRSTDERPRYRRRPEEQGRDKIVSLRGRQVKREGAEEKEPHLSELMSHSLELSNGLSELLSLVGVGDGLVESSLGKSDHLSSDSDSSLVKDLDGDLETKTRRVETTRDKETRKSAFDDDSKSLSSIESGR